MVVKGEVWAAASSSGSLYLPGGDSSPLAALYGLGCAKTMAEGPPGVCAEDRGLWQTGDNREVCDRERER